MKRYPELAIMLVSFALFTGCADRAPTVEPQSQIPPSQESNAPLLTEGETVTIDGECEFHVDYAVISETPEHYYEAESGKTYVDFCITYQNLGDYTMSAGNVMEGKLIYSGQYEYAGTDVAAEEDGVSLSPAHWIDLGPSDATQVHYFFTVSGQVQDSSRMVELDMSIGGNDYRYIVREGEKGVVSMDGDAGASSGNSGVVAVGEVVSTDNAQFYVEHAEFTKEVIPPSTGAGYNYYTAEDGKVFVDFCVAYTNLSGQSVTAYKAVSAKLEQAQGQATVTEQGERSMFDYSNQVNVIPLCTEYIHCIFQVPEELESGSEPVTISFKIDGSNYTYSVR